MGVTYTLALLVQRNGLAAKISSLLEQSSREFALSVWTEVFHYLATLVL